MSARVCRRCGDAYRALDALNPLCYCPRCERAVENASAVQLIPHKGRIGIRRGTPRRSLVLDLLPMVLLGAALVWIAAAVIR